MKIKTSKLMGPALDWAVAKALDYKFKLNPTWKHPNNLGGGFTGTGWWIITKASFPYIEIPNYSTNWTQGGPIIDTNNIEFRKYGFNCYLANIWKTNIFAQGHTLLIATMRAFVISKLGNEIEIPNELK